MNAETLPLLSAIDVTCPACDAGEGEPCRKWCDDDYIGTVSTRHYAPTWDD